MSPAILARILADLLFIALLNLSFLLVPWIYLHCLTRTWLLTGELYLRLGQIEAAELCANEARQVCHGIIVTVN